jgi:non-homologous end joining protein Ku
VPLTLHSTTQKFQNQSLQLVRNKISGSQQQDRKNNSTYNAAQFEATLSQSATGHDQEANHVASARKKPCAASFQFNIVALVT